MIFSRRQFVKQIIAGAAMLAGAPACVLDAVAFAPEQISPTQLQIELARLRRAQDHFVRSERGSKRRYEALTALDKINEHIKTLGITCKLCGFHIEPRVGFPHGQLFFAWNHVHKPFGQFGVGARCFNDKDDPRAEPLLTGGLKWSGNYVEPAEIYG